MSVEDVTDGTKHEEDYSR